MLIASRELIPELNEIKKRVRVDLFSPVQEADCWQCMYRIICDHETIELKIGGVDSFQALIGAVALLEPELRSLEKRIGCRLIWEGQGPSHGFPVQVEFGR